MANPSRRQYDTALSLQQAAMAAPILGAEEERTLIADFQGGSDDALHRLLAAHLRLVVSMARRYAGRGASLEDLVGEGNLGLVEAARRFEAERGNRFSTYASWWVRARVRRFALSNRRIVAPPSTRNARKIMARLREAERQIAQAEGRSPLRSEVAKALGVPEVDVTMVSTALGGRDIGVGPYDEAGVGIELRANDPSPEQLAEESELSRLRRRILDEALAKLTAREREILSRRYLAEEGATLAVLGESLGLSRERVRQIEKRAQEKLRVALPQHVA